MAEIVHASDCDVANAPAYEPGACTCGTESEFVDGPDLPSPVPVKRVLSSAARSCERVAVVGVTKDGLIYIAGSDGPVAGTLELLEKGLAWFQSDDESMEFH